jgi:asparagine synthase (glutamine-hydrolysing)
MCGIVGYFGKTDAARPDVLGRMASTLAHRGPDDQGLWTDSGAGIGLAHRRLSIVDLSPAGHQPMLSGDGRFVVSFNGEIYNHRTVRAELDAIGPREWAGHSDTEVLLAAIAAWGLKRTLQKCVGMFALALWDRQARTLTLARDRMGEKPLYYGKLGNSFVFASEIKALRVHPAWNQDIDRGSLALFLRHNYIPAPYTIYAGISKLRPGHILVLRDVGAEPLIEPYWSVYGAAEQGRAQPFAGSATDAVDMLETLLRQALDNQMLADVPLGAFLSGGIDSSTVVALMQSMSTRPIRTFTIGFDVSQYDEARHAKKVAAQLGTEHCELYVTERDAMDVIPMLPSIYCEPFSDSSQIPTFLVSKLARSDVTVALSGDGGDELFSGYDRYGLTQRLWNRLSMVPGPARRVAADLARLPPSAFYDRLLGPILQLVPKYRGKTAVGQKVYSVADLLYPQSIEELYLRMCSHTAHPEQLVRGGAEHATILSEGELPPWLAPISRMMYADSVAYLPDDILVKVDRAAMAVSLETRMPLLDHRVVEFAFSLPLSILRSDGATKWPLRQILYRHVPRDIVERPKMGFGVPMEVWLRTALRDWAADLLSETRLRQAGLFHAEQVHAAWQGFLRGENSNHSLLWNILVFQAWHAEQGADSRLAAA